MFIISSLVLLGLICFVLSQILILPTPRAFWKFLQLPMYKSLFVFGPIHELMFLKPRDLRGFCESRFIRKYQHRLTCSWLLGHPFVMLILPDDIKDLLGNLNNTEKGIEYKCLKPWLSEGLVTSKGKKWVERRKMLTGTFHFKILEDNVNNFWRHGKELSKSFLLTNGEPTSLSPFIFKCTLDVICETAMNIKVDPSDTTSAEYIDATKRVTQGATYRLLNFYLNKNWLWNLSSRGRQFNKDVGIVHSFTEKVISMRRKELLSSERRIRGSEITDEKIKDQRKQPFLDRLIEMDINYPGVFTDDDIREEVDTFMFVGHDSTSGSIEFLLWELGLNPIYQEKAYEEIRRIFGGSDRELVVEDLQRMQFLEMIIKETLRLYPAAPYISRELSHDLVLDDGTTLAAGFNVTVSPFVVHRNPSLYRDPEKFDPYRFTPEECAKRHPYAYIPFSAGPRNCLGQKFAVMEMKAIVSTILRSCKIESVTSKEDAILVPLVTLSTDEPLFMKIFPRTTSPVL